MKLTYIPLMGLALCLGAPILSAQDAPAPQDPAAQAPDAAAVQEAVRNYHTLFMYRSYIASAEMLEDPSYDNDLIAMALKTLEIAEGMPMDGLPESYQEYLRAKNARQRKTIEQISAIMGGRSEEELTEKDLFALRRVQREADTEYRAISRRYPEAEAALGDAASQAFSEQLSAELNLEEEAKNFLLEHPEITLSAPELVLAASLRHTADIILQHMEAEKK